MKEYEYPGRAWLSVLLLLGLTASAVLAQDADIKEKILAEFYPYRQGVPQVEGITPGMTINKSNAQVAAAVLPPEVLKIKIGRAHV